MLSYEMLWPLHRRLFFPRLWHDPRILAWKSILKSCVYRLSKRSLFQTRGNTPAPLSMNWSGSGLCRPVGRGRRRGHRSWGVIGAGVEEERGGEAEEDSGRQMDQVRASHKSGLVRRILFVSEAMDADGVFIFLCTASPTRLCVQTSVGLHPT